MKGYSDIAAALRNTPAAALREAGYLDRAARMFDELAGMTFVTDDMISAGAKAVTDRYYAGGKMRQLTSVKPRELANIVLRAAFACEFCEGSGYIRSLGRDNTEIVDDCPVCPTPPASKGVEEAKSPYDRNCDFCGPGWTGAHKHRCPRAMEDYSGGLADD